MTVTRLAGFTPDFRRYLLGLAFTSLADAVLTVTLPLAVLASGGGAGGVALVVLCSGLPRF
ncbi:hypothetical protein, partial [Deinococcus pimensis]|uniref:hypothetical protein n=1 Tax=Deinococcus pimensis TaxID=309888 RepID=UPI0005EB5AFF